MLAYSWCLDTSVILKWLINKGYEVIAYVADVGQNDDFEAVREKALAIGASSVIIEDLKREFVTDYIFQAVKANALAAISSGVAVVVDLSCLSRSSARLTLSSAPRMRCS